MIKTHGDVPARKAEVHEVGLLPAGVPQAALPRPLLMHEGKTCAQWDGIGLTYSRVKRNGDALKATFLGHCSEPMS